MSYTRKTLLFILSLSLLIALSACSGRDDSAMNERLAAIHELSDYDVVAAIDSFKSIGARDIEEYGTHTQKLYQLLGIRLRYQADIVPTSDDSIVSVCAYMDKYGTPAEQIEAYYYMGAVYSDRSDFPRAIEACLKADEQVAKLDNIDAGTIRIVCKLYSLLAYLHRELGLNKKSVEFARKEYETTKKYKCVYPKCILDLGFALCNLDRFDEAKSYYDEAVDLIVKQGTQVEDGDVLSVALRYYSYIHNRQKSDSVYNMLTDIAENERPYNYYDGLTDYYVAFDFYDRLIPTMVETAKNLNIGRRYAATYYLAKYSYKFGNYKKSAEYGLKLAALNDSIQKQRLLHESAIANGEEVYRQNKEAEMRAIKETSKMHRLVVLVVIIAGGIFILLYWVYRRRQKQLDEKLSKNKQSIDSLKRNLGEQTEAVLRARQLLSQKECELVALNSQIEQLDKELQDKIVQNKVLKNVAMVNNSDNTSNVWNKINESLEKGRMLDEEEWKEVFKMVETNWPEFLTAIVANKLDSNEQIMHTALLLKLGLPNAKISVLTGSPRQSTSNRIRNIKERIGSLF